MSTTRIGLTVSTEMDEAMERLAQQRRLLKSQLIRDAIAAYLEQAGIKINSQVEYGGDRSRKDEV